MKQPLWFRSMKKTQADELLWCCRNRSWQEVAPDYLGYLRRVLGLIPAHAPVPPEEWQFLLDREGVFG